MEIFVIAEIVVVCALAQGQVIPRSHVDGWVLTTIGDPRSDGSYIGMDGRRTYDISKPTKYPLTYRLQYIYAKVGERVTAPEGCGQLEVKTK